jgi:hypothetical protein
MAPRGDRRDMTGQSKPGVGQHDIDTVCSEACRDLQRSTTGDGHLAGGRRQRFLGERNALPIALEENMTPSAFRYCPEHAVAQMRESVGDRLADRYANDGNAQSNPDPVRKGKARADPGKRPRTNGYCDEVDGICLPRHT